MQVAPGSTRPSVCAFVCVLSHWEAAGERFTLRSKYALRDNIGSTFHSFFCLFLPRSSLPFFSLGKYIYVYINLSLSLFLVVGILHWLHNSHAYLHRAGCAVSSCVCVLADIVAGAADCGQQGLDEAFFFFHNMDSSITHTHIKQSRECILWRLHLTEGGHFGEGGGVWLR